MAKGSRHSGKVKSKITKKLLDGDRVGSLLAISCPGHSPGHFAYLDTRDNSLIVGDAFMNQTGVTAAGVFKWYFPLAAWFAWNEELSARSAAKLLALNLSCLSVGHGPTIVSPNEVMKRAVEVAYRQHPSARGE